MVDRLKKPQKLWVKSEAKTERTDVTFIGDLNTADGLAFVTRLRPDIRLKSAPGTWAGYLAEVRSPTLTGSTLFHFPFLVTQLVAHKTLNFRRPGTRRSTWIRRPVTPRPTRKYPRTARTLRPRRKRGNQGSLASDC